jgi:glycosyltransferase
MKISLVLACPAFGHCPIRVPHAEEQTEVEPICVDERLPEVCMEPSGPYEAAGEDPAEARRRIYEAFNEGISLATGDVVGLLHLCDSLAYPGALAEVCRTLDQTGADAVYGDLAYVAGDDRNRLLRYWRSGHWSADNLANGWVPPLPAFFARREIYERAKRRDGRYFVATPDVDPGHDLMVRMLVKMRISLAYLPTLLVKIPVARPSNQIVASMSRQGGMLG